MRGPLTTFKQVVQIVKRVKQGYPVTLLEPELLQVGRALMPGWERQLLEWTGPIQRTVTFLHYFIGKNV